MWPTPRLVASCVVASLTLLASTASAGAAPKRVSGELSKPGYTVIALAADGRATSAAAGSGRFSLRLPATRVTLHLRGSDGTYAGPVVVGRRARRAVLGVRAGARLGRVVVRRGYARVARRLAAGWLDSERSALAKRGVPIGARRFGRVRARLRGRAVPGDADRDGVPDVLDIDDDGDLILDKFDRRQAARASQEERSRWSLISDLTGHVWETANANARTPSGAPSFSDQEIEAVLPRRGLLMMSLNLPGDERELDCGGTPNPAPPPPLLGGLTYCSHGGTGRVFAPAVEYPMAPPFPDCCDPDADGFGTLTPGPMGPARFFYHGATTAQIGTGDVLIQRVTTGGVERQYPAMLEYVFATVPALVSYDDGQGNSGAVSYPVPGPDRPRPIPVPPGPGSRENGIPVAAGPSGVVVSLTFWRPQRRPIPPETAPWIDMGGLNYGANIADVGLRCPPHTLSESDPNLTPAAGPGGFADLAIDKPADPRNTLTYTLNMSACLGAYGRSWSPGEVRGFHLPAQTPNAPARAGQHIFFKRVS